MDVCALCGGELDEATVVDKRGSRVVRWCRVCGADQADEGRFWGW